MFSCTGWLKLSNLDKRTFYTTLHITFYLNLQCNISYQPLITPSPTLDILVGAAGPALARGAHKVPVTLLAFVCVMPASGKGGSEAGRNCGTGWRQKLAEAEATAQAEQPVSPSLLVKFLVSLWSWGLMSPQTMQVIASKVLADVDAILAGGAPAADVRGDLEKLAGLGSHGSHQNKMHPQLVDLLPPHRMELFEIRVPLNVRGPSYTGMVNAYKQFMLLPHLLFAAIGNFYPNAWKRLICPSRERLQQFWASQAGNPQLIGVC